jgi:hypothetical protein
MFLPLLVINRAYMVGAFAFGRVVLFYRWCAAVNAKRQQQHTKAVRHLAAAGTISSLRKHCESPIIK